MPTVLLKNGYRFYFYSEEGREPPHIHVAYGSARAKFWLISNSETELSTNIGFKTQEIKMAKKLILENYNL